MDKSKLVARRHYPDKLDKFCDAIMELAEFVDPVRKAELAKDYKSYWEFLDDAINIFKKHGVEIQGIST